MFQLENIDKSYGGQPLFEQLTWQIPDGKTIGLVGPNGAGKTTLFRILTGGEEADGGRVVRPRQSKIGYLPQELAEHYEGTVLAVILDGRADLLAIEQELQSLEARLGDASEQEVARYSELQDRFRRQGGYELRSRALEFAAGMGFSTAECQRPLSTFSGGWKMRALLARLLLSQPDLLLLDEPTNHLDVESIEWLEQFLITYSGTVVTISHDRFFLNRLVDAVAELHDSEITVYPGDYDHYLQAREERRQRLIAEAEKQARERAKIQEFVDRFRYQASKASLVQSRIKRLEKMEPIAIPPAYDSEINFEFPAPGRVGKVVMDAREITKRFEDIRVYDGIDFQLGRGDRVAFVGPNGSGKSTLLKILAGQLAPDQGIVEAGHNVEIAYFAQHSVDQLTMDRTVLEEMEAHATYDSAPQVRDILGAFLFSGDDVHKQISVLSGGEKSRLALAKLLLAPAGCLLLDEPTNHLDIPSRRMLEHALNHFQGAFCVVSHDRYFLNEVVNRVVHIEAGKLRDYPGSYEEYRWRREGETQAEIDASRQGQESSVPEQSTLSRKEVRRALADLRDDMRDEIAPLRREVTSLMEEIERLESQLAAVEATLAKPETHEAGGPQVGKLQKEYGQLEAALMDAMAAWEAQGQRLEALESEYAAKEAAIRSQGGS